MAAMGAVRPVTAVRAMLGEGILVFEAKDLKQATTTIGGLDFLARRRCLRIICHEASGKQRGNQEKSLLHSAAIPLNPFFSGYHSKNPEQADRSLHCSQSVRYLCFQSEIDLTARSR